MINVPASAIADIRNTALSGLTLLIKRRITNEPLPAPKRSEPYNNPILSLINENALAILRPKKKKGTEIII